MGRVGGIGTLELAEQGVGTSKLTDGSVTAAKLAASAFVTNEAPTGPTTTTNANDTYTSVAGKIRANSEAVYVGAPGNMTRVQRAKYTLTDLASTTKVVFALGYIPSVANGEVVAIDYIPA